MSSAANPREAVVLDASLDVPEASYEHLTPLSANNIPSRSLSPAMSPPSRGTLLSDTEHTVIDNERVLRGDLQKPSAADFNPGYSKWPVHQMGNAASIGLAGFALSAFLVGLYLAKAGGITVLNVIIAPALFYGGVVQFLAGVLEMIKGNTFAGTAFVSFGAFWLSFGALMVDSFGILAAYGDDTEQYGNALGFFLLGWGIFSFLLLMLVLKSTWPFIGLFVTLTMGFFMLAAGFMTNTFRVIRGGGILILISALFGWYSNFSGVSTRQNTYLVFPTGAVPVSHRKVPIYA
ncbi:uncharacterized protein LODBEIA_P40930 [Lodderomyces beijingensis]|uniref:Uncharacterized protein n=1 Tax=Lodderomyces beijingensis TaxID=1775926 RepID=A0ABP0ZNY9_9ASCO